MPKGLERKSTKLIPRIYKKSAENLMLFTWVTALRQTIPTISVDQAIYKYFDYTGIDDWDIECARMTYFRIQKEYYQDCKSECHETT